MTTQPEKTKADLILEKIAVLETELQSLKKDSKAPVVPEKPEPEKHSEESRGHKDIDEILSCPNCKPKVLEKVKPEISKELEPAITEAVLKAEREKHKKMKSPRLCEDCGEILDAKENKDCPTCHGTRY